MVEEKDCTYRVNTPERKKKSRLFHVSGMKKWTLPVQVMSIRYCEESQEDTGLDTPVVLPYELYITITILDILPVVR